MDGEFRHLSSSGNFAFLGGCRLACSSVVSGAYLVGWAFGCWRCDDDGAVFFGQIKIVQWEARAKKKSKIQNHS